MKKLQLVMLGLSVLLWTADRISAVLPDWTIRLNGAMMLAGMVLLVFASARLAHEQRKED